MKVLRKVKAGLCQANHAVSRPVACTIDMEVARDSHASTSSHKLQCGLCLISTLSFGMSCTHRLCGSPGPFPLPMATTPISDHSYPRIYLGPKSLSPYGHLLRSIAQCQVLKQLTGVCSQETFPFITGERLFSQGSFEHLVRSAKRMRLNPPDV